MKPNFKDLVYDLVKSIPYGKVMTYGQIAALCGSANSARVVGQIAHYGETNLPWHRVVNRKGNMASGYVPGGMVAQARMLESEEIKVIENRVDLAVYLWWPKS
jgi:methylated-DNA-protein-cysteine methyltransferase-like protein